jgi:DNA-binding transcriptional LysR family regulator
MSRPLLSSVDLRLFVAVAQTGGITAAARLLGLQKSAVSRDLMRLEEEVGARLLHRTTRKVSLTEAGRLLAAYAGRVVEEMDAAAVALEAMRETPRGELRVSLPFAFARFVLAPALPRFRAAYPEVRLRLDASPRIVDLVEEGFDAAIRVGELPASSLVARLLGASPLVLAASPGYLAARGEPARLADLAEHDLVDLAPGGSRDRWTLAQVGGGAEVVPVSPALSVADPSLARDLVVQGLGVGVLPGLYLGDDLAVGRLRPVLPGWNLGAPPIHIVYPSRRSLPPKTRAFLDFVAGLMAKHPSL